MSKMKVLQRRAPLIPVFRRPPRNIRLTGCLERPRSFRSIQTHDRFIFYKAKENDDEQEIGEDIVEEDGEIVETEEEGEGENEYLPGGEEGNEYLAEDEEDEYDIDGEEIDFIPDTQENIDYEEARRINIVEPCPGLMQQTLWRSFVIGGIGLHSGEVAYVRVRPAFAGDGRYFVRVSENTNKDLFSEYEDEEVRIYPDDHYELDEDAEVYRSKMFLKYLDYKEQEGYVGDFKEFLLMYAELKGIDLVEVERIMDREEPVPKTRFDRIIPAQLKYLANEEPRYETTLENEFGYRVESVEHLLAALEACGVDNARIEIEGGPEVPVVDGSSLGWTIEIEKAGVTLAECGDGTGDLYIRAALKPDEIVRVQDDDAFVMLIPGDKMQITYGIDHTHSCPKIGCQWFSWCLQDHEYFKLHLAAAKTFVTHPNDLYAMRDEGYLKAGSEAVILIGDGFDWHDDSLLSYAVDEPVRHKILDLIGDLSLLGDGGMSGLPFGHIIAYKANHAMHHAFAKEILEKYRERYKQFQKAPRERTDEEMKEEMKAALQEHISVDELLGAEIEEMKTTSV